MGVVAGKIPALAWDIYSVSILKVPRRKLARGRTIFRKQLLSGSSPGPLSFLLSFWPSEISFITDGLE